MSTFFPYVYNLGSFFRIIFLTCVFQIAFRQHRQWGLYPISRRFQRSIKTRTSTRKPNKFLLLTINSAYNGMFCSIQCLNSSQAAKRFTIFNQMTPGVKTKKLKPISDSKLEDCSDGMFINWCSELYVKLNPTVVIGNQMT